MRNLTLTLPAMRHKSYNEALAMLHGGHMTQDDFERFSFAWRWSATRFGGVDGAIQDAFYNRRGRVRYYNRINRVRKVMGYKPVHVPKD